MGRLIRALLYHETFIGTILLLWLIPFEFHSPRVVDLRRLIWEHSIRQWEIVFSHGNIHTAGCVIVWSIIGYFVEGYVRMAATMLNLMHSNVPWVIVFEAKTVWAVWINMELMTLMLARVIRMVDHVALSELDGLVFSGPWFSWSHITTSLLVFSLLVDNWIWVALTWIWVGTIPCIWHLCVEFWVLRYLIFR